METFSYLLGKKSGGGEQPQPSSEIYQIYSNASTSIPFFMIGNQIYDEGHITLFNNMDNFADIGIPMIISSLAGWGGTFIVKSDGYYRNYMIAKNVNTSIEKTLRFDSDTNTLYEVIDNYE